MTPKANQPSADVPPNPSDLPISVFRDRLDYDPETGLFVWRERPLEHFKTNRTCGQWRGIFAGKPALCSVNADGYLRGEIRHMGRRYCVLAHRVAFCMMVDRHPSDEVDHINGVRSDNRWANLREASTFENAHNALRPPGRYLRGVQPSGRMWVATIRHMRSTISIGKFRTEQDAHLAYLAKERELRGSFSLAKSGRL